jgi:hypothetical protein
MIWAVSGNSDQHAVAVCSIQVCIEECLTTAAGYGVHVPSLRQDLGRCWKRRSTHSGSLLYPSVHRRGSASPQLRGYGVHIPALRHDLGRFWNFNQPHWEDTGQVTHLRDRNTLVWLKCNRKPVGGDMGVQPLV